MDGVSVPPCVCVTATATRWPQPVTMRLRCCVVLRCCATHAVPHTLRCTRYTYCRGNSVPAECAVTVPARLPPTRPPTERPTRDAHARARPPHRGQLERAPLPEHAVVWARNPGGARGHARPCAWPPTPPMRMGVSNTPLDSPGIQLSNACLQVIKSIWSGHFPAAWRSVLYAYRCPLIMPLCADPALRLGL
jgi:hypothetical protein